jgi:hypothetical protein
MQFTSILLAALTATGALAAPRGARRQQADNTLTVILENQAIELGSQTTFEGGVRQQKAPSASAGPFKTVELVVGCDVVNQAHRCQILDERDQPIVVIRGNNTDTTFADGNAGIWTLAEESFVSQIICDPTFVKGAAALPTAPVDPTDNEIRVILQNQATELGVQRVFQDAGRQELVFGGIDRFQTIELSVGEAVRNQGFRCQVLDLAGIPIVARRGAAIDTTFADGGLGAWTFLQESAVGTIICDPAFVANNLAA